MAPAHLLGRYLSVYGLTFTISLALGPAIGGLLLQTAPDAVWWGGGVDSREPYQDDRRR